MDLLLLSGGLFLVAGRYWSADTDLQEALARFRATKAPADAMPPGYRACTRPNFGSFFAAKFGIDGTLYLAGTAGQSASSSGPNDPFVARTKDLGRTWGASPLTYCRASST